ncbi:MAG TPA: gas vesicle protein GvpG [Thermoanaerobaculia bacterium]|nr:gas vesicle protein GvpG [Thermoanaerobaculia bacterium]
MFLIDDILLFPLKAPVAGFNWILRQIQTMADEQLLDDQPWKERLIELQMMLEVGEISEEDFAREEAIVFQRLREIRQHREEIAARLRAERGDDEAGPAVGIYTGYGE